MESAIDMQHLSSAIIETALGNCSNRISDVFRLAHATLRQQTVGDALLIGRLNRGNHVGTNDAWLNFEYRNVVRREAGGEKLDSHRYRCFGHTIIAAIDRSGKA